MTNSNNNHHDHRPALFPGRQPWGLLAISAILLAFLLGAGPRQEVTAQTESLATPKIEPQQVRASLLEDALKPDRIETWLENMVAESDKELLAQDIIRVYEARSFRPAWVGSESILRRARTLVRQLSNASRLGLSPEKYSSDELAREVKRTELDSTSLPVELIAMEIRLTGALLLFVDDLHEGIVDTQNIPHWYKDIAPADVVSQVVEILDSEKITIEPEHPGYLRLAEQAVLLRERIAAGGWPTIPEIDHFAPGETIPEEMLEPLVARLQAGGDLSTSWTPSSPRHTPTLVDAVKSFQERHGLEVDGKVGPETLASLNVSAQERLRQIEANLERWRWMPAELPADRIEVNVAAFELRGYRDALEALRMDIAVGKPSWATPIFEDEILYAEVNPYWNVPESIAIDEVLPALRENPNYLREENMETVAGWGAEEPGKVVEVDWSDPGNYGVDYRIRQRPGRSNALGQIKFIFPNQHGVYLHDTPAQSAFQKADRAVSHGCVRVSDPMALADFLFDGDKYDEIQAVLGGQGPHRVDLEQPIPVLFNYWTAFVDDKGRLSFREDLYGLDEALSEHIAQVKQDGVQQADYQRARNPRVST